MYLYTQACIFTYTYVHMNIYMNIQIDISILQIHHILTHNEFQKNPFSHTQTDENIYKLSILHTQV